MDEAQLSEQKNGFDVYISSEEEKDESSSFDYGPGEHCSCEACEIGEWDRCANTPEALKQRISRLDGDYQEVNSWSVGQSDDGRQLRDQWLYNGFDSPDVAIETSDSSTLSMDDEYLDPNPHPPFAPGFYSEHCWCEACVDARFPYDKRGPPN